MRRALRLPLPAVPAVLAVGVVAVAAAALADVTWVLVAGLACWYLAELTMPSRLERLLARAGATPGLRMGLRVLLLVAVVVGHGQPHRLHGGVPVVLLLVGVAVALAVRPLGEYLHAWAETSFAGALHWRNLDVDVYATPAPVPRWHRRAAGCLDAVPAAAALLYPALGVGVLVGALPISVGAAVRLLGGLMTDAFNRGSPYYPRVYDALVRTEPRVVVYFSSPPASTYALNVWLDVLDALPEQVVIFLAEAWHLRTLGPTRSPVLVLPRPALLRRFRVPSLALALYPSSVANNDPMLALDGMRHVLIGHGDSDKDVTASPLHRAFDETWVAGPAARDRYLRSRVGVRDEQIRVVGRPQLASVHLVEAPPTPPFTVLYAPTWEGNFDASDYSSVAGMGRSIVAELLHGALPVRLLFKPHPATGQRSARARRSRRELEEIVRAAGPPHRVVSADPEALYEAFNESDLLIADISSVVPDYLASRKPYLVTNPRGISDAELQADFTSTTGGYVVAANLSGFAAQLVGALGPDPLRARRWALAEHFLGTANADPLAAFSEAVGAAVRAETQ